MACKKFHCVCHSKAAPIFHDKKVAIFTSQNQRNVGAGGFSAVLNKDKFLPISLNGSKMAKFHWNFTIFVCKCIYKLSSIILSWLKQGKLTFRDSKLKTLLIRLISKEIQPDFFKWLSNGQISMEFHNFGV